MKDELSAVCYDCKRKTTRVDHRLAAVGGSSSMKGIRATYYAYLCEDCAYLRSVRAGRPCISLAEELAKMEGAGPVSLPEECTL